MESFLLKYPDGISKLENDLKHHCQTAETLSPNNPILKLANELRIGLITLESANESVNSGRFNFMDRWEYMLFDSCSIPDIYGWNVLVLGDILPFNMNSAALRLNLFERTVNMMQEDGSRAVRIRLQTERGFAGCLLSAVNPQKYLEPAIHHLETVLSILHREDDPYLWARVQLNLGAAFSSHVLHNPEQHLEQAISCLNRSLAVFNPVDYPMEWATSQNNLGNCYSKCKHANAGETIEKAIACFNKAANVITIKSHAVKWASIQNNLGNAYCKRISGHRGENIETAIFCFKNALKIHTRDKYPIQWATLNNNLGNAYSLRLFGDRGENIQNSIRSFEQALEVRIRAKFPLDWATTQHNLGMVWFKRRTYGNPGTDIETAISHYQKSLEICQRSEYPIDWASTQHNLGTAYHHRIYGDRSKNIQKAIECFKQALMIRTRKTSPVDWAATQNNLGNTLRKINTSRKTNIRKAILCYEKVLEVRTRQTSPSEWASAQHNLGMALYELSQLAGVGSSEFLNKAVFHLENCLSVITPDTFPVEARDYSVHFGNIHVAKQDLPAAINAYRNASKADSNACELAVLANTRIREIEAGSPLFFNAAWCLAGLGQSEEALEWLENGKTRSLSEQMTLHRAKLHDIPVNDRETYISIVNQIRELEYEQQNPTRDYSQIMVDSRTQREELRKILSRIKKYTPDFVSQGIHFNTMASMIRDNQTAFLFTNITEHGSVLFILHKSMDLPKIVPFIVNEFKTRDLFEITRQWTGKSTSFARESTISDISQEISERLFCGVFKFLSDNKIHRLVIIPHLDLHIFPLHLLSFQLNGIRKYICEYFELSFAPSLTILHKVLTQHRNDMKRTFAGLAYPAGSLAWSVPEVKAISQFFTEPDLLLENEATPEAVLSHIKDANIIHFACHGHFVTDEPGKSFLELAPPEPGPQFEPASTERLIYLHKHGITLEDIFKDLNLPNAFLVVLSACESGKVSFGNSADEYIGLSAGFIYAGARFVIASLWAVNDRSTCLLMEKFYDFLITEKKSVPVALRDAQIWLRDEHEQYNHPYYWAGFQVIGM